MNEHEITGMQFSVSTSDESFHLSLGSEDRQNMKPLLPNSIMRIGSVSKLLTSIIVMSLVETNLINLDEPVYRWFPDLPNSDEMTVRQIMNHTSGVENYTTNFPMQLKLVTNRKKVWTFDEIYKTIIGEDPLFEPGEDHYYSNSNYILLGKIAEIASGKNFSQLVDEFLVEPLDLENTTFVTADHSDKLPIPGYDIDLIPLGDYEIDHENLSWPTYAWAAGAFASTSTDMNTIVRTLYSGQLLSSTSLNEMTSFYPCTDEDIPVQTGYGLGMRRFEINQKILTGHTGTILGFGAGAFFLPEEDITISFIANQSWLDQIEILKISMDILKKSDYELH